MSLNDIFVLKLKQRKFRVETLTPASTSGLQTAQIVIHVISAYGA